MTTHPETFPGRKIRRARKRLEERQREYDAWKLKSHETKPSRRRPGSIKC